MMHSPQQIQIALTKARTLQELADNGWQILYFTAKQEVSDTMIEEYDLNHTEMEDLSTEPQNEN